jgi:2-dehydro-3-deoxy-D-gluconate 5-dehydrogenase
MFDLTGKVAIVTGGNGGIGLGMARGLARAGARVVVAARNQTKSEAAVRDLEKLGGQPFSIAVDVADEAAVAALVKSTVDRCGRLDILVNNAGTNVRKQPQDYTLADWHHVIDTNLTSAFLCSRAVYAPMKAAGGGKIINIGSMMSIFGVSFSPAYGPSKGGLVQLTKSLATAWAKDNIQVNAFHPGYTDTEFMRKARQEVPGMHEKVISRSPMKRWGVPEDFAGLAVFLASPASSFVTGASIFADGGFSCM